MTIALTSIRQDYTGSGITGPYTFPFCVFNLADLKVITTDLNGNDTILVLNVDYTVVGIKGPTDFSQGGTITLTNALTTGFHLAILSNESGTQPTSIKNNSAYYAYLHENEFDRLSLFDLNMLEKIKKAIVAPDSEPAGTTNQVMPHVAQRANKIAGWDVNGNLTATLLANVGSVSFSVYGLTLVALASVTLLLQSLGLFIGPAAVANGAALAAIVNPQGGWIAYQTDTGVLWGYNAQATAWYQISWSTP